MGGTGASSSPRERERERDFEPDADGSISPRLASRRCTFRKMGRGASAGLSSHNVSGTLMPNLSVMNGSLSFLNTLRMFSLNDSLCSFPWLGSRRIVLIVSS